ncbi:type IV secretory system conjugative DNA transfer family protein [Mycobacteroides abscessus]|uniref:type IV secretory system conjugative DNA transfer family protein n=2 Tax=Mycobacteroides abscessus TaxID=36809 RepID=UPI000C25841B|nr:FtsK/SpoIIIE domain-containing protein [Mycobacteroides abscessus]
MVSSSRAARRAAQARRQEQAHRDLVRRQEQAHRDLVRDSDAADSERERTAERVRTILARAQSDAEKAAGDIAKRFGTEEKRLLSAPITRYSGATRALDGGLVVWHWKATCSAALAARLGVTRNDAGPLCVLRPGGGLVAGDSAPDVFAGLDASLLDDADFMDWTSTVAELWHGDVTQRYQILGKLRDDAWWARLSESAGISDSRTDTESLAGHYGPVERKVTIVQIPSISAVEVTQDGLEISFSHAPSASAAKWASKLDLLKNGLRAAGMNASHLRLTDSSDGGVVMRFDDAPSSFPKAIAPPVIQPVASVEEAKQRYKDFRWQLGLDARGNVIAPSIREVFHVLAVGGTGSGKSVWIRGLIESARLSGFRVYLGDGKMSDYPALENASGVVMRSSDAPQHVVLVAEVHDEMVRRQAVAEQRKREGAADPFDFEPILLVMDEFASMRGDVLEFVGNKRQAMEPWLNAIAAITRKGRELKIHLVLASQDLYVENIPNQWQANFQLLVSLGEIEDKTLDTKFIPDALKEEAKRVGARITRKDRGRGLFVDKANPASIKVTEFQSSYSFSPGSTLLTPNAPADVAPPTDDVRVVWEQQQEAAAQMPRLYPRVGIKVEQGDWSKDASATELMAVPTIALDDADGNPVPNLVKYDQRTAQWLGREQATITAQRGSAPTTKNHVTPPVPAPADIAEMTDIERREAIRQEAIKLGLIPDDEVDEKTEQAEKTEENAMTKTTTNGYSL